jgi:MFS superfamily sulfate permease-like transporter
MSQNESAVLTAERTGLGETFAKDFMASIVVFLVALPLCMGIAIASGVPPALGLITGIVGGLVVGTISGSPLQVSGPAAGLTVLVWEMVNQHGIGMLGTIVLLAGALQLAMGLLKAGQWFRAISPAVIQGMLAGIGVLIIASQIHVMVDDGPKGSGLRNLLSIPEAIWKGLVPLDGSSHHLAALVGVTAMAVMFAWGYVPKRFKLVPAPLVAVVVVTIIVAAFQMPIKNVQVAGNLFADMSFPTGATLARLLEPSVIGSALALCLIASAETLLCATAVDRMHQGPRTQYNRELFAQGVGNTVCGLLGALPMTGVIVRSSANVEAGGRTRLSAILHGAWILGLVVLAPGVLNLIPTTALAAILVYTGFKLVSPKAIRELMPYGKLEVGIYLATVVTIPTTALAAILVYTGFKLVSPKAIRELMPYGKLEVGIYLATVVGIVTTNLLVGVLIGLGLALAKLLYTFAHLEVRLHDEPASGETTVILKGSATFIKLPQLAAALEAIPAGGSVKLDIAALSYIDHACLDLISNWRKQYVARNGHVELPWDDLRRRYHERGTAAEAAESSAAPPVTQAAMATSPGSRR